MGVDGKNLVEDAARLKADGNAAFAGADWASAIALYSQAIATLADDSRETAVLLKNRAAAYLKTSEFAAAERDCDRCLQLTPMDSKALFRRCQALEGQQRFEEAYRDARALLEVEPQDRSVQATLERLFSVTQERSRQSAQTAHKVDSMLQLCFGDGEKREHAFDNLLVLARERAASELMLQAGVVASIQRLLQAERNPVARVACVRVLSALCRANGDRAARLVDDVGAEWCVDLLDADGSDLVGAAQHCVQTLLDALAGGEPHQVHIDRLLTCLTAAISSRVISALGRDAVIELLMRNCHHDQLAWAERLVAAGGVERLLEVGSELGEFAHESAMRTTPSTRTVAAACVARLYENMYYEAARARFLERVDGYVGALLVAPDGVSKVRAVAAITALLRGALDVGTAVVGRAGLLEMLLVMANGDDDALQQRVAVECLVAAASKADKARAIVAQGVDILKRLYATPAVGDDVRVRALVGLCKLGSAGGSDASVRTFADGATCKLAAACRRFLVRDAHDARCWAAEGLSYLTLDADVKEQLAADRPALQALMALARTGDQSAVYGVVTTLANLCNAHDQPEMPAELVQLARFAKHHVPEAHALDAPEYVGKRLDALADAGVTSALVALARAHSASAREQIARVFNALCGVPQLRGGVVADGGAKALLPLAERASPTTTPAGWRHAAQALARIAITMDPVVAFPGQRLLELVRPLVALLADECGALENFEAMMALCNVAQSGDEARQRILREGGRAKLEHYMYEDHVMLRRAATQAVCNLALSADVVRAHEGDNDKLKYLVALILDDDLDTAMAAAGAAAILTASSVVCCRKVMAASTWVEAAKYMLSHGDVGMQHRGVAILRNVLAADRQLAEAVIATDVMEVIMAVTKLGGDERKDVVHLAEECLQIAEGYGIIRRQNGAESN